jgi:precorrin-8X/cobalt-precorrin-8 methylmutase
MPLFDTYVFVDWSAKDTPAVGRDSIWIATGNHDNSPIRAENVPTRSQARLRLAQLLCGAVKHRRRVLVGLDFPYGYPRGLS